MTDRWIDVHSVTCALCGELADERETLSWDAFDEPAPGASSTMLETAHALVATVGSGEAHASCFEFAERNGVPAALEELRSDSL